MMRLWWRGDLIDADSDEFQELIDRAFIRLYNQNEGYRQALKDTNGDILVYKPERKRADRFILTEYHFIRRLRWLYRYGEQYDFADFMPDEMQRRLPFQIDPKQYEEYNKCLSDAFAAIHIDYDKERAIQIIGEARQILIDHGKAGRAESKKELKNTIDSLSKWEDEVQQMEFPTVKVNHDIVRKNMEEFEAWMREKAENE